MKTIGLRPRTLFVKFGLNRYTKSRKFDLICKSLEQIILVDLSRNESFRELKEIKSKHLILSLSTDSTYTNYENFKLLIRVLKTRGRLRWLCLRVLPSAFPKPYEYTRLRILLKIFINWKLFSSTVLSKLCVDYDKGLEQNYVDIYEFTHPDIHFVINPNSTYLLGNEINQKLEFSSGGMFSRNLHSSFILGRIIFWDSTKILTYIRERSELLENPKVSEYLNYFPDFLHNLNRNSIFSLEVHKNASSTFDEISTDNKGLPNTLKNVEIWHQRFIVGHGKWHVIDSTCSPYTKFVAGHWQFMEQLPDTARNVFIKKPLPKKKKKFTEAIFLMGRADENWYHFLLDTLPRYLFMQHIDQDIPVLVRADIPKTSIALIERAISRRVILVYPTDVIAVERLYFIAARSTVYDSSPPGEIDQVAFSPKTLSKQRQWLLKEVSIKNESIDLKKIFLPRKAKYRNLLNSDQVGRRLEKFGFSALETGEDFFTKQHIYFSNAHIIVSPGGAILANILFMKKGTKIITLRSWRDSKLKLWKKLAKACNVEYNEIAGIPTYFGRKLLARQHSNYFIPVSLIKKSLKP